MLNIFKLKGPRKTPVIEFDIEDIPKFKYFKNADTEFIENIDGNTCICCGKRSKYVYKHLNDLDIDFEALDIHCESSSIVDDSAVGEARLELCPECIANGKATNMLKFKFNSLCSMEHCSNKAAKKEIRCQTPSVFSFQDFRWPSCCDDMCQYVGNLGDEWHDAFKITAEMDPLIVDAIQSNKTFRKINRPIEELVEACNQNEMSVLIFRCLHCGKYRVIIDLG